MLKGGKEKMKIDTKKIIILIFTTCSICKTSLAQDISLSIIAQIESANNPQAYNSRTKATGLYQITPICLQDYNNHHKKKYCLADMLLKNKAHKVADWYLNKRIPSMLKYYGIANTIQNRLIAYNYGIGHLRKKDVLPQETKNYIKKYFTLCKR